jgi:hypothetical protein
MRDANGDHSIALTYLQHTHPKGVPQNLVSVGIVAIADVGRGHEEGEGVVLLGIQQPPLHHLLHLLHPLLLVTAQSK